MIFWVLFLFIVAFWLFTYLKNKQADRSRHRRERLQEKQEELIELLKKQNAKE